MALRKKTPLFSRGWFCAQEATEGSSWLMQVQEHRLSPSCDSGTWSQQQRLAACFGRGLGLCRTDIKSVHVLLVRIGHKAILVCESGWYCRPGVISVNSQ